MSNSFGDLFRISCFGESHGKAVGVIVDGCPAGLEIERSEIQAELNRRRPGQSEITTPRDEKDSVEILSGIFEGKTLGTPITLMVRNEDQLSKDYDNMKNVYRPGHADYTYDVRYGIRDHRGGGRSSNRESIARVAAGALAKKMLYLLAGTYTLAWVDSVKNIRADVNPETVTRDEIEKEITRCPDPNASAQMEQAIKQAVEDGDSLGGTVKFCIRNCPAGMGAPMFKKITSELAKSLMSINATRSFSIGMGEDSTYMTGKTHNDPFIKTESGEIGTRGNNAGGVLGGISTGQTIYGKISFKPVSTIRMEQDTVDSMGNETTLKAKGRHDPCVLPRAVPIVEAMINLMLADQFLLFPSASMNRLKKIFT